MSTTIETMRGASTCANKSNILTAHFFLSVTLNLPLRPASTFPGNNLLLLPSSTFLKPTGIGTTTF
jgi:hypothetical protein